MQCPVCEVTLSVSAREGVEIDFCPQCRGVWLDRGELDKIIERANVAMAPAPAPAPAGRGYDERPPRYDDRDRGYDRDRDYDRGYGRRYDDDYDDRRYGKKRKRRGGFLEDLFDFD
jgi:Zn-finger nucleic acid-binding protein